MGQCQPTPAPAGARSGRPAPGSKAAWLRRLPLLALAVLLIAALALGLHDKLSLTALRDQRAALQGFVRRHPVLSLEVYAGAYAAIVALSIPGALVMSLGGGYLFGALAGAPAAIVGETAGATAMFLACRLAFAADAAQRVFRLGGMARRLTLAVEDNPFSGLLMLRLIPAVPFTLVNLAAGLVRMPLGTYVAATVIGIAPSTFIYAWVGQGLGVALNRNGVPRLSSLIRPEVYLPLAALGVMGTLAFAWRVRRKGASGRSR